MVVSDPAGEGYAVEVGGGARRVEDLMIGRWRRREVRWIRGWWWRCGREEEVEGSGERGQERMSRVGVMRPRVAGVLPRWEDQGVEEEEGERRGAGMVGGTVNGRQCQEVVEIDEDREEGREANG